MNRSLLKRVFPQLLAWTALIAFSGAIALAQDAASAPAQAAEARSDGQIEMDVVHALDASPVLKNDLITAATIQSEVTLSGTVSSQDSRKLAESIAGQVAGVTKVNNNLTVGNPQATAQQPSADSQQEDSGAATPEAASSAPAMNDGPMPPPASANAQGQYGAQPDAQAQLRAQIRAEVQAQLQAQREAREQTARTPVTVPQGTLLQLRTVEPVGSKRAKDGEQVQFTVIQDVYSGPVLAIPRGATLHGVVTEVKKPGQLTGSSELALKLTSLDLGGQSYPIDSDQFKVKGPGKGGRTASNAIGGAMMGSIIGCIAGRGIGCAIGAGAGAAAGTAASAATPGPGVWIPAEARVDFHLNSPLTVTPVGAQEASRLAQGLYPGGPSLYRRGYYPYGRPYYAGYPYGYPPVYYRPYYVVGGYYTWR
jgi:hypothetical protein